MSTSAASRGVAFGLITPVSGKKRHGQFGTQTAELRRLAAWLREHEVKHVVMEATGSYWRPVWNLLEMESFEQTLANPQHMKAVPGRKTDTPLGAPRCQTRYRRRRTLDPH